MKIEQAKNRREGGAFLALPVSVLSHKNFYLLSGSGMKLLFELLSQIRLKKGGVVNNGDLCAAWTVMGKRGWRSRDTLYWAIQELLHYGWIFKTRQGGRKMPTLYAVTFFAVNECRGKLDCSETRTAQGDWKKEVTKWIRPKRKTKEKSVKKLNSVTRYPALTDTYSESKPHPPPEKAAKTALMTRIAC